MDLPRSLISAFLSLCCASGTGAALHGRAQAGDPRPPARDPTGLAPLAGRALEARLAALASEPEAAREAARGLFHPAAQGEPPALRRARAWLLVRAGTRDEVGPALTALAEAARDDRELAQLLLRFLGRPELGDEALEARCRALADLARAPASGALSADAIEALAELDQPVAHATLLQLVDDLAGASQRQAAGVLATRAGARAALLRRVFAGWPGPAAEYDDELAASLLAPLARALVDAPELGDDAALCAVLGQALRHPDARVAAAARHAGDAALARLELFGDAQRGERVLGQLAAGGVFGAPGAGAWGAEQRAELELWRTRAWLRHAADPAPAAALAAGYAARAAELGRERALVEARAALLAVAPPFAAGDQAGAQAQLERVPARLAALAAQAAGRAPAAAELIEAQHEELAALADLARLCLVLAPDVAATGALADELTRADPPSREPSRAGEPSRASERRALALGVHRHALAAQRAALRAERGGAHALDALFESELSLFELALENPRLPAWPGRRALALCEAVGRELAAVAPAELPGLGAANARPADSTLADPARLALLKDSELARLELVQREFARVSGRLLRVALGDPCGPAPALAERAAELWYEREEAVELLRAGDARGWRDLAELRLPSGLALELARAHRDEGRPEKARALLEELRRDLDASGAGARYLWGLELAAEIEMTLGSTWSDVDEPARAEEELRRSVERLEGIEQLIVERGFAPQAAARVRAQRASALVSLAVNANVKQRDPARALEWFEQAWQLRQDEFLRVLRACYRARAGRHDEARALLREVTPSPLNHYNMACTYALCGDTDLALDFLRRDLDQNQPSPDARAKQAAWARRDPDLASLAKDPRFVELVKE